MSQAALLLAVIANATGPFDFPARLNTTAGALYTVAEARFAANQYLEPLCTTLYTNPDTDTWLGASSGFTGEDATIISFFLEFSNKLLWLSLAQNRIGDAGAVALGEALKHNGFLDSLILDNNGIAADGAAALASALRANTRLFGMDMKDNPIGDAGVRVLSEGLAHNTGLREIHLGNTQFADAGAVALGAALKHNSVLSSLILNNNFIGASGAAAIADGVVAANSALSFLDVRGNFVRDAGGLALGRALRVSSKMRMLECVLRDSSLRPYTASHAEYSGASLRFNSMSSAGGCALLQLLRPVLDRTTLLSDWSEFSCDFLSSIANATGPTDYPARINMAASTLFAMVERRFIANSNLEPLCAVLVNNFRSDTYGARGSGFIDEDGPIIGFALASNTHLTGLDLGSNNLGFMGVASLSEALKSNYALTELSLCNTLLQDDGAARVAEALQVNTALVNLDLHGNSLSDVGVKRLGEGCKANTALTDLNLSDNPQISSVGWSVLEELLQERYNEMRVFGANFTVPDAIVDRNRASLERTAPVLVGTTVLVTSQVGLWSVIAADHDARLGEYALERFVGQLQIVMRGVQRWRLNVVCALGERRVSIAGPCVACPEGTASGWWPVRFTPCAPCPDGTFSAAGSSACAADACLPGTFCNSSTRGCTKCPAGKHSVARASSACADCPIGSFTEQPGSSLCVCPAGWYTAGNGSCAPCPPGTFAAQASSTRRACEECAIGTFAEREGSHACQSCAPGTGINVLAANVSNANRSVACVRRADCGWARYSSTWTDVARYIFEVNTTGRSRWGPRADPASAVLPDGSIVVVGGFDTSAGVQNDVWRTRGGEDTWHLVNCSAGAIFAPRARHTVTLLPDDGGIVVLGGVGQSYEMYDDVWLSKDAGDMWTKVCDGGASMWQPRAGHTTAALPGGALVVLGGQNVINERLNDVWRSNDSGASWQRVISTPTSRLWRPRYNHATVAMPNGDLVLVGGSDDDSVKLDDVWLGTDGGQEWFGLVMGSGPMWAPRSGHSLSVLPTSRLVLAGGEGRSGQYFGDVWLSDDVGRSWNLLIIAHPPAWPARAFHSAAVLPSGDLLLLGGLGIAMRDDIVWRVRFSALASTRPSTNVPWSPRMFASVASLGNGAVCIMGGLSATGGEEFGDVWRSEDEGVTWQQTVATGDAWQARHAHSALAFWTGAIVVMGGLSKSGLMNDVWTSNNAGSSWSLVTSAASWSPRSGHRTAVMASGRVCLVGGQTPGYTNDVWVSSDGGRAWEVVCAIAQWSPREGHGISPLSGDRVLLFGGFDGRRCLNDVWVSSPGGGTWSRLSTGAPWPARFGHAAFTTDNDQMIVVAGGIAESRSPLGDVWMSGDEGVSWILMTAAAPWRDLVGHSAIALPSGSMLIMAGYARAPSLNASDVWRTFDRGRTWERVNASPVRGSDPVALAPADEQSFLHLRFPITPTSLSTLPLPGSGTLGKAWSQSEQVLTTTERDLPRGLRLACTAAFALSPKQPGMLVCGGMVADAVVRNCWWIGKNKSDEQTALRCDPCEWTARHSASLASWPRGLSTRHDAGDVAFLFGGVDERGRYLSELWLSTTSSRTWVHLHSAGTAGLLRPGLAAVHVPGASCVCERLFELPVRIIVAGGLRANQQSIQGTTAQLRLIDVCISLVRPNVARIVANATHIAPAGPPSAVDAVVVPLPSGAGTCLIGGRHHSSHNMSTSSLVCTTDGELWTLESDPIVAGVGFGAALLPKTNEIFVLSGPSNAYNLTRLDVLVVFEPWVGARPTLLHLGDPSRPLMLLNVTVRCAHADGDDSLATFPIGRIVYGNVTLPSLPAHALTSCPRSMVRACVQGATVLDGSMLVGWPASVASARAELCSSATRVHAHASASLVDDFSPVEVGGTTNVSVLLPHELSALTVTLAFMWIPALNVMEPVPSGLLEEAYTVKTDNVGARPLSIPVPAGLKVNASYELTVVASVGASYSWATVLVAASRMMCRAGYYASPDTTTCVMCDAGKHQRRPSQSSTCDPCEPGTVAPGKGRSQCEACSANSFPTEARTGCTPCPSPQVTQAGSQPATSSAACGCPQNTVAASVDSAAHRALRCESCSEPHYESLDCSNSFNRTASQMPTRASWWRNPARPDLPGDRCLASRRACLGGPLDLDRRLAAAAAAAPGCALGHGGVLCMRCEAAAGWARAAWAPARSDPCIDCSQAGTASLVTLVITVVAGVAAFYLVLSGQGSYVKWLVLSNYRIRQTVRSVARSDIAVPLMELRQLDMDLAVANVHGAAHRPSITHSRRGRRCKFTRSRGEQLSLWLRTFTLMVQTVQVGLRYTEVAAAAHSIPNVVFNGSLPSTPAIDAVWEGALLDMQSVVATGCIWPPLASPLGRLLLATVVPLVLVGVCVTVAAHQWRRDEMLLHEHSLRVAVNVATFTATGAQTTALASFACRHLKSLGPDETPYRLLADPTLACHDPGLILAAIVASGIFCVAYPTGLAVLLRRAAKRRSLPRWLQPAAAGMKPEMSMLEIVVPLQRTLSIACFVFLTMNSDKDAPSPAGAALAALLHLLVLVGLMVLAPFNSVRTQHAFLVSQAVTALCMVQLVVMPWSMNELASPHMVRVVLVAGSVLLAGVVCTPETRTSGRRVNAISQFQTGGASSPLVE